MPRFDDTIAALATPAGTAAIAVLRVSGPKAVGLAREIFRVEAAPRVMTHADYVDGGGSLVDDVLFTVFRGPQSYTGEDGLEISCHGNPFIAQRILEDLFARGCRPAGPGEFTQRAFLNGRMDLSQAEAVMDLIHARSERALRAANQQLRGALGRRMGDLVDGLLDVLARVEAYIDFPEEDLPEEDRNLVGAEIERLLGEISRLIATSHYGSMLRDGIKTVIIGAPNVGKSSLLNRLVGQERAIVSPEPGTTRDFIEECIMVGPHWLRIVDTAGLNPSPAPLEKLGMEKTVERAADADLFLVVLDATLPCPALPESVLAGSNVANTVVVVNKADLLPVGASTPEFSRGGYETILVSALSGSGIEGLVSVIASKADQFRQDIGEEVIAISSRHADALIRARRSLIDAKVKLSTSEPAELLASDLRAVLEGFGEISGRIDNEKVLDHLFSSFCIGK